MASMLLHDKEIDGMEADVAQKLCQNTSVDLL